MSKQENIVEGRSFSESAIGGASTEELMILGYLGVARKNIRNTADRIERITLVRLLWLTEFDHQMETQQSIVVNSDDVRLTELNQLFCAGFPDHAKSFKLAPIEIAEAQPFTMVELQSRLIFAQEVKRKYGY